MKNGKIKILFEYLYLWQIKILVHNFEVANWFEDGEHLLHGLEDVTPTGLEDDNTY
jgi:hypothetical protein